MVKTGRRLVTEDAQHESDHADLHQLRIEIKKLRYALEIAEAYRVALAPHNPQGPVSTAASIELGLTPAGPQPKPSPLSDAELAQRLERLRLVVKCGGTASSPRPHIWG